MNKLLSSFIDTRLFDWKYKSQNCILNKKTQEKQWFWAMYCHNTITNIFFEAYTVQVWARKFQSNDFKSLTLKCFTSEVVKRKEN